MTRRSFVASLLGLLGLGAGVKAVEPTHEQERIFVGWKWVRLPLRKRPVTFVSGITCDPAGYQFPTETFMRLQQAVLRK